MARSKPAICLAVQALLLVSARAQDATPTAVISSTGDATDAASQSSITASSSEDAAMGLWGAANSLLTSYYPSTSLTNIASLSWPATVVLDGSTFSVHPESSTPTAGASSSSAPTASSTSNKKPQETSDGSAAATNDDGEKSGDSGKPHSDKRLGIALGAVFGVIGFALLGFILFWVHRRNSRHGGNGIFRRSPSLSHSEIDTWRTPRAEAYEPAQPEMGMVTTATGPLSGEPDHPGPSRVWLERYNRLSNQHTPPAHLHPAFANSRHPSDDTHTSSEDNPFFTPMEQPDRQLEMADFHEPADFTTQNTSYAPGYLPSGDSRDIADAGPSGAYAAVPSGVYAAAPQRHSSSRSSSSSRESRPPTPFSPMMMMMQTSSSPARNNHNSTQHNPFTSPQDADADAEKYEQDDLVSPILPARSPQRRHSPIVHYPSWSEVSEFDFTGEHGGRGRRTRDSSSGSDGGDGWKRERESVVGRTELA